MQRRGILENWGNIKRRHLLPSWSRLAFAQTNTPSSLFHLKLALNKTTKDCS